MARRFGRNQRRQMRTLIEQQREWLSEKHDTIAKERDRADQLRHRLTSWAQEIAHLMGDYSPFNEQVARMDWRGGDTVRLHRPMKLDASTRFDAPVSTSYNVIEAAITTLHVHRDSIAFRYFIKLNLPGGQLGYAIDQAMLADPSPRLVREFADTIARSLADAMRRR